MVGSCGGLSDLIRWTLLIKSGPRFRKHSTIKAPPIDRAALSGLWLARVPALLLFLIVRLPGLIPHRSGHQPPAVWLCPPTSSFLRQPGLLPGPLARARRLLPEFESCLYQSPWLPRVLKSILIEELVYAKFETE